MADAVQAKSLVKKSGFTVRPWRGDVSLPVSYWVLGTGAVVGMDYKYIYTDSNNATASIAITKSDCHNLI